MATEFDFPLSPTAGQLWSLPSTVKTIFKGEYWVARSSDGSGLGGVAPNPTVVVLQKLVSGANTMFDTNEYIVPAPELVTEPTVTPLSSLPGEFVTHYNVTDSVVPWNYLGGEPVLSDWGIRLLNAQWKVAERIGLTGWFEFQLNGDEAVLKLEGNRLYRFTVEEGGLRRYVKPSSITLDSGSDGLLKLYKLDFPTSANRVIQIEVDNANSSAQLSGRFGGIYTKSGQTVTKPTQEQPRFIFIGDSSIQGVNGAPGGSNAAVMAGHFDVKDAWISANHSTGTIHSEGGVGANRWSERRTDWLDHSPNALFFHVSWTDHAAIGGVDAPTSATVVTKVMDEVLAARAAFPDLIIVVVGLFWTVQYLAADPTIGALNDALASAVVAQSDTFMRFLDLSKPVNPFTGTGKIGATTGDGNADIYVGADEHYSEAGDLFVGRIYAEKMRMMFEDMLQDATGQIPDYLPYQVLKLDLVNNFVDATGRHTMSVVQGAPVITITGAQFDGDDAYGCAASTDFAFGLDPFHIRGFATPSPGDYKNLVQVRTGGGAFWQLFWEPTGKLVWGRDAGEVLTPSAVSGTAEVAFDIYRTQDNILYIAINGTILYSTSDTVNYSAPNALWIGGRNDGGTQYSYDKKIRGLEIYKGVAIHGAADFTPPAPPVGTAVTYAGPTLGLSSTSQWNVGGGGVNTASVSPVITTTAGRGILVLTTSQRSDLTLTDSKSNTGWVYGTATASTDQYGLPIYQRAALLPALQTAGTSHTFTATWGGAAYGSISVFEVIPPAGQVLNLDAQSFVTDSTSPFESSLTAAANTLLFAHTTNTTNAGIAAAPTAPGWTVLNDLPFTTENWPYSDFVQQAASAGAYPISITYGATQDAFPHPLTMVSVKSQVPTVVQMSNELRVAATATSGVLTFAAPVTEGNGVIVCANNFVGPVTSVVGSIGGAYTRVVLQQTDGFNSAEIWYAQGLAAGTETITVTVSSSVEESYFMASAIEVTNLGAVDKTASTGTPSDGLTVTASGPNVQANMIVISCALWDTGGNAGFGIPAGFTLMMRENNADSFMAGQHAYKVVNAIETSTATITSSNGTDTESALATFRL